MDLCRPTPLYGPRLVLRRPYLRDAAVLGSQCWSVPAVMRYQGIPLQRTAAEATRLLRNYQQAWLTGPPYRWVIICPSLAHTRAIGIISYIIEAKNVCSIGYTLAPAYWGCGYATEALKAVMRWAFEIAKVESIENQCHPDNKASIRVLEKAGFQWDRAIQKEEKFPNLDTSESKNVRLYTVKSPSVVLS